MRYILDPLQNKAIQYAGLYGMLLFMLVSCSPAKYIPEGGFLLDKNKVESSQRSFSEDKLKTYLIQKPNKKIMGFRFHLFLYNLSNIKKNKWPHNWLRRIGEEPVVYNPISTATSVVQLRQFLQNKGYYHAVVGDTVIYKRKNAKVYYRIDPHEPLRVKRITYYFEDTGLMSQILPDTLNTLIRRGMKFDKDVLQNERLRIEAFLKEKGYFRFSKEYIYFKASIDEETYSVNLVMGFKEFVEGKPDPRTKVKHHAKYLIGRVFVYPDYASVAGNSTLQPTEITLDTTRYQNLYFLTFGKPKLKLNAITNINYIIPGQYYALSNVTKTYRNLSELGPIRYVNISFKESDSLTNRYSERLLDCRIELTRKKVQSYQTELAGTNSGGDLGIRGNLSYQNLNLIRGAEVFNFRVTGAVEALKNRTNKQYTSMKEIGVETGIIFPKFFSPLRLSGFVRKYSPKTSIAGSFNYQSRPDYTRSIANGSFSYKWYGNPFITHTIWPLEVNYVQIYEARSSQEFIDSIMLTPLGYSFEDHLVNVIRYGFELNNQSIRHSRDFVFLRFSVESAGNLVNALNKAFNGEMVNGHYQLFNVPFFQYIRGDFDIRYYNIIDQQNKFAYRLYIGLGNPYGNSSTLPFEKKFFSGGPNSIRAWSSRDLGPGSYVDTTTGSKPFYYPNKSGDIKLEGNIEYRFKVIWKMEAGIFLDAGNIWGIKTDPDKPGAEFEWNRFYKEVAVGTGLGARFDFSFFLLRVDFGLKVRDPSLPPQERWLPVFRDFALNHFHMNFGIGYPF
jgi:outer membrane protein assembly factor BamA